MGKSLQCKRPRLDPCVGKIPWRRGWLPTPVFLPRESQGEEPGGIQSMGSQSVRHNWGTNSVTCLTTLMSVFPSCHRSHGQSLLGCWVSSTHIWASAPHLLDPSSLSTRQSWPGPVLLNPHSRLCDWMNLGHGSWFRVLYSSFGLSFHQEMILSIPMFAQIFPSRTKHPGNTLNQDCPGGPEVKMPHFPCRGCWSHPWSGN